MPSELEMSAPQAAQRLLGSILIRQLPEGVVSGKIVETEAYDQNDPASHTYGGMRPRAATMFGPAGHLYIYLSYGMHYCCNIVCGDSGFGAGVLIRALEPLEGISIAQIHRGGVKASHLFNGPGKICKALQIDKTFDGHDVTQRPLQLLLQPPLHPSQIIPSPRVGISKAADTPWRFSVRGSPWVSRPWPSAY